ncbi:MAG: hypothetical protein ACRDG3_05805 [Tepidiformaceae bacterium]
MKLGDTFIPLAPQHDGHLWVVISEPTPQNRLAIVNFTTRRPACDDSCIARPGEHPFLNRESILLYARARLQDVDALDSHVKAGYYQVREPVGNALLRRIQEGALQSIYTSGVVQSSVRATLGY